VQQPPHFVVANTGVGILLALQLLSFDRFTKAQQLGLCGEKTTGLGMSTIKTIVGLHQRCIWFESAEGQGIKRHVEVSPTGTYPQRLTYATNEKTIWGKPPYPHRHSQRPVFIGCAVWAATHGKNVVLGCEAWILHFIEFKIDFFIVLYIQK